ncbi:MAG: bifunctional precorrin-2 dehydrogenase/sirohydrochlorin ferrochelatase [Chloroflexota bacterium]|nr:bifunctional precorrin-2 dehydrogenase/sirohydrochlorin ferrochelatase [Chloroflexota bacterium]MDE2948504.1 bifunctional precorrin-2 dehydrogenase/sirohydrochlorin ferrochelatase [Chloroflexota bacterium]
MPEALNGYPVLLHLKDKPVAVIGGGEVAARKVEHLLNAGARVLLISPEISPALVQRYNAGDIVWLQAAYQRDMFQEYMPILVIAATDDERVNQTVAQDAHRIRALCNVANGSTDGSDFSNMAQIDQPPLTVALSTSGKSPALLRMLKAKLAADIGEEYSVLADWLGAIRRDARAAKGAQKERQALYEAILDSAVLPLLRAGKTEEARHAFNRIVHAGITT